VAKVAVWGRGIPVPAFHKEMVFAGDVVIEKKHWHHP